MAVPPGLTAKELNRLAHLRRKWLRRETMTRTELGLMFRLIREKGPTNVEVSNR